METFRSQLKASPSPRILSIWPVVPNLSTRGQALLAAFGLHKEVVITEKGKKENTKYEQYKTAQKRGLGASSHPEVVLLPRTA